MPGLVCASVPGLETGPGSLGEVCLCQGMRCVNVSASGTATGDSL